MLASVTIDNRVGFPALLSMVSRDYILWQRTKSIALIAKKSLMARAVMMRSCNCGAAT